MNAALWLLAYVVVGLVFAGFSYAEDETGDWFDALLCAAIWPVCLCVLIGMLIRKAVAR